MKALFAFVLAALVVNACVRTGDSAWRSYQLRDAVAHEARYGEHKTATMLRKRIVELAQEHDVELTNEDVVVEKRAQQTYVSVTYVEGIPLVPGVYTYQQDYDITMTVLPSRQLEAK